MAHGKGQIPRKKIEKILKANGYRFVRSNGHDIFGNDQGIIISVPRTCNRCIMRREFKAKGLPWNI